jgi:hypothetical protein
VQYDQSLNDPVSGFILLFGAQDFGVFTLAHIQ